MVTVFLFPLVRLVGSSLCRHSDTSVSFITLPFLARDSKAVEIVQIILESVLLRREKDMRDSDGKRIVELPEKEVTSRSIVCTISVTNYNGRSP